MFSRETKASAFPSKDQYFEARKRARLRLAAKHGRACGSPDRLRVGFDATHPLTTGALLTRGDPRVPRFRETQLHEMPKFESRTVRSPRSTSPSPPTGSTSPF